MWARPCRKISIKLWKIFLRQNDEGLLHFELVHNNIIVCDFNFGNSVDSCDAPADDVSKQSVYFGPFRQCHTERSDKVPLVPKPPIVTGSRNRFHCACVISGENCVLSNFGSLDPQYRGRCSSCCRGRGPSLFGRGYHYPSTLTTSLGPLHPNTTNTNCTHGKLPVTCETKTNYTHHRTHPITCGSNPNFTHYGTRERNTNYTQGERTVTCANINTKHSHDSVLALHNKKSKHFTIGHNGCINLNGKFKFHKLLERSQYDTLCCKNSCTYSLGIFMLHSMFNLCYFKLYDCCYFCQSSICKFQDSIERIKDQISSLNIRCQQILQDSSLNVDVNSTKCYNSCIRRDVLIKSKSCISSHLFGTPLSVKDRGVLTGVVRGCFGCSATIVVSLPNLLFVQCMNFLYEFVYIKRFIPNKLYVINFTPDLSFFI